MKLDYEPVRRQQGEPGFALAALRFAAVAALLFIAGATLCLLGRHQAHTFGVGLLIGSAFVAIFGLLRSIGGMVAREHHWPLLLIAFTVNASLLIGAFRIVRYATSDYLFP